MFNFTAGTNSWNVAGNWTPSGFPNAIGTSATFNDPTAAQTTNLSAAITVGTINLTNNGTFIHTLANGTGGSLNFQTSAGNASLILNGTSTITNMVTVSASTIFNSNTEIIVNNTGVTTGTGAALSFTGALTGTGNLIKSGAGRLSLTASAKTYTGATIINQGRLRFSVVGLPNATSSLSVASSGQLFVDGAVGTHTFGASAATVISIAGIGTAEANGQLGAMRFQMDTGTSTFTNVYNVSGTAGIHVDGLTRTTVLSNVVNGTGSIVKTGSGVLTFSNANTGSILGHTVTNGTISTLVGGGIGSGDLSLAQATGNNTAVTLLNATQTIGNLSSTFVDVTGTQAQTLTLTGTALTINQTANTSFGTGAVGTLTSVITGTGSVTMSSSSTNALTLSGANTYSGNTTINGGTLVAANISGSATGAGSVTINTGGTFAGGGFVTGATNVNTGGTIRGGTGAAVGNLTTGNVIVANGGSIFANLGAITVSSKLLVGASTLDLKTGSVLKLDDVALFSVSSPATWNIAELTSGNLLLDAGTIADGFVFGTYTQGSGNTGPVQIDVTGLPALAAGDQLKLSRSVNNLVLAFVPVPEPALLFGIAAGIMGLGAVVRKKFFAPATAA